MRAYNFENCDIHTLLAITELQEILQFQIAREGLLVILKDCESGFHISKKKEFITIAYQNKSMLFRAILTMIAKKDEEYDLDETCAFQQFGILVDMSRNAVINTKTIKEFIIHIALLGYNALLLYTEDTFVVQKEDYFGYMRGALTSGEIKEIEAYCDLFGIELIPCIQCLAHLNQITRYQEYDSVIDVNDILLVGEERTTEFLEHMFQTIDQSFKSRKINIGMDEAHMLGLGKYLEKHGYENRTSIMLKHLNLIRKLCKKYGFTPSMWSDMFLNNLEDKNEKVQIAEGKILLDQIPKDVQLIYWNYYFLDYESYKNSLKRHFEISNNIGFAGGAWKWTGFAPDNEYSIATGTSSMKACKELGVNNFLLTCWGDNGAEASLFSILPTIYYYAECAYGKNVDYTKFQTLSGITFEQYMMVDLPNRLLKKMCTRNNASKYFLYNDILFGTFDSLVTKDMSDTYRLYGNRLRKLCRTDTRYTYMFDVLQKLCRVLSIKVDLGVSLKDSYTNRNIEELNKIANKDIPMLLKELRAFYYSVQKQWLEENKPFGFEVQCIRLGGLITRIEYSKNRLKQFLNNEISTIEELEMERKPFHYFDNKTIDQLIYNLWDVIVSPSVI